MTAQELFEKYCTCTDVSGKCVDVLDLNRFTAALAEAMEGGHIQPVVMPGRDNVDGKGEATFCTWKEDEEGNWWCDCDNAFCIYEGSPLENGMKYCCYCGRPLKESRFEA